MAVSILSNLASFQAQRRLGEATHDLQASFTRLSSGLRINHGADDASGLSVGTLLKTDSRVFTQGVRNANDAVSLFNIAEGAALQLDNIITRVRELAEQSANGVLSAPQRKSLDSEAQALISEYSRITSTTNFNGLQLLGSSSTQVGVQLGYNNNNLQFSLGAALNGAGSSVATGDGTFQAAVSYAPGGGEGPNGIELADVNGDGKLDAVVTSHSAGTTGVDVMLNNGSGGFGAATLYSAGHDTYDVKLADFNGDGKIDIAATDLSGGFLDILLNSGTGTFALNVSYAVPGGSPIFMDVGDLNNDGKQDIVLNSQGGGKVDVFLGVGNGTFSAGVSYSGGGWNIAIADVNNDGLQDVTTNGGGVLKVLLGTGGGALGVPQTLVAAGLNVGLTVADFNHDGFKDFAVGNSASASSFQIFLNNSGTGVTASGIYNGASNDQSQVAADMNGDGNLDLVFAGRNNAGTFVALGNSDGTFKASTALSVAGQFQDAAVGDINGDGALDIVSTLYGSKVFAFTANATAGQGVTTQALLSQIDLKTQANSLASLTLAAQAADNISREIANIGAAQSRLTTASSTLKVTTENTDAAASRIFDVDVATETSSLTRAQILQQASAAVLGQANQIPALALQLLRF